LIGETGQELKITINRNEIDGDGIDQLKAEAATYSCEAKISE
jgi:hypothetical protein